MKKIILNNIFLKIISVALAFILWLVLVNIADPTTKVTITGVAVRCENENALYDKGYTYDIVEGEKISVDVSGPKSKIVSLTARDIWAVADLSTVSDFSNSTDISVSVVQNGEPVKDVYVTSNVSSIELDIYGRSIKTVNVVPVVEGTITDNNKVTEIYTLPNSIDISGNASDVDRVANVKAVYNADSDTGTEVSADVSLVPVDEAGNELRNLNIAMSRNTVRLDFKLQRAKTVPIRLSTKGEVADGYRVSRIYTDLNNVLIYGDENILNGVNEITVLPEDLDISGISENKVFTLSLRKYLPNGINSDVPDSFNVNIEVERQ